MAPVDMPGSYYSHRNGEIEPPTVEGYYWFKGQIWRYGDPQDIADLKTIEFYNGTGIIVSEESDDFLSDTKGRWWGPVVPPWDTPQPVEA